jgi:hypothetical protein
MQQVKQAMQEVLQQCGSSSSKAPQVVVKFSQ